MRDHARPAARRHLRPRIDALEGRQMLTADGAKLLDFGLAKSLSGAGPGGGATTSTLIGVGVIAGTLQYMAPEQIEGQPVDERCDIFAFGAIVYEMLAGRAAFTGDTVSATMAAILIGQPAPLRDIPSALAEVIAKCLAKRPADRIGSAAEIVEALKTPAFAPNLTGMFERPRSPSIWMAVAAIAVIAVVGDGKEIMVALLLARDHYTALRSRMVLDRIADEVAEHLLERRRMSGELR